MSDSPKIDEALAKAMYNQQFNQLAGEPQWDDISQLVVTRAIWIERALTVRAMLLRAGYSIRSQPPLPTLVEDDEGR